MLAMHCNLTKKTIHKYSTSPCMVQDLAVSLLVCLISVREAAERISKKKKFSRKSTNWDSMEEVS